MRQSWDPPPSSADGRPAAPVLDGAALGCDPDASWVLPARSLAGRRGPWLQGPSSLNGCASAVRRGADSCVFQARWNRAPAKAGGAAQPRGKRGRGSVPCEARCSPFASYTGR